MVRTVVLLLPIFLAACGQSGQIEKAVREQLKDPDSAKFKDMVISSDGNRACIVWNAKNSLGGYGDWDVAELEKVESGWKITRIKGQEDNCTPSGFKALDARPKAEFEATQQALELLSKATGQKHDTIKDYGTIKGQNSWCSSYAEGYVKYSVWVADKSARGDIDGAERYKVRVDCSAKAISTGGCDIRNYNCERPETAKAALECGAFSCQKITPPVEQ